MATSAAASAPAATSRARPLRLVGATMMVLSTTAVGVEVFLPGGLASLAAGNPPIGDKQGYWGHKTMNIQPPWCEADYHVTHYVAEFWNSLTSVTIILYGLWGIVRHHRSSHGLEPRFWAAFGALCAVGAGSVLFHMTLWRIGQVMDELPMVWGNSAFVYVCLSMHDLPGTSRPGSVAVLALITAAITVIYVSNPDAHGPFLLVYGSGLFTIVILSWRMASAKSWNGPPLMEVALCSYFFGLLLWVTERTMCSIVQPFQLHAAWHLFAGFGTYTLVVHWISLRWDFLGRRPVSAGPWAAHYVIVETSAGQGRYSLRPRSKRAE